MNTPYPIYQCDNNVAFNSGDDDHIILNQVVDFYHRVLKQNPATLSYLTKHGIDKSEVIEHFKLGYCNRTLGYQLPEKNRKEGAALRGKLQRIGILKPNGHELFRGCIVVPVLVDGVVKHIYGRKMSNRQRSGTSLHCELPNTEQGFFNLKAIQICEEVIFCSSIIDALTFWCAGYKNVTHIYGLDSILNDSILEILKASPVKRALIAFEENKDSNEGAKTLAEQLHTLGIDTYCIEFPKGTDANAYALKNSPGSQSLGNVIRKASWIGKGLAPSLISEDVPVERIQDDNIESDSKPDIQLDAVKDVITVNEIVDEPLPATVLPEQPEHIDMQINDDEIIINLEDRRYRVRGLEKNLCYNQLKVNLLVNKGHAMHVDVFDLYGARVRANFIKQAALELNEKEETIKSDLAKLLLKLEVLQASNIHQTLASKVIQPELSIKEQTEAMNLLQSPDLLKRILKDFKRCGVVGETTNILVSYLATLS